MSGGSKVGKGPATKEAPAAMAVSPPPAPEPVPESPVLPASADHCRIMGLTGCSANTESFFEIEAVDENGKRSTSGGDSFFIAIRGASRVRARVSDNKDGTYTVMWKPELSGNYEVAISLFGNAIAGSPFTLHVHDHLPCAPNCEVKGRSLHHIIARTNSSFEIIYRDRSGIVCQAVELDVYVMPIGEGEEIYLWKAATQPNWGPEEDVSTVREVNAIDLSPQDDKTKKKKKDALEKALEKSEKAEKGEKTDKKKSPTKLTQPALAAAEKTEMKEKGDKALAKELKGLNFSSAKEIDVGGDRLALLIYVPPPQLAKYRAIQKALIEALEKALPKYQNVMLLANRTMMSSTEWARSKKHSGLRPRNRSLKAVQEGILDDLVFPSEITGKRIKVKEGGDRVITVQLGAKEKEQVMERKEYIEKVYQKLTTKNVVLEVSA